MHDTRVDIDVVAATTFLDEHIGDATNVEYVAEGMWSRCFGFVHEGRDLVVRFGRHIDDFEKDRAASEWRTRELPIPEVFSIGKTADGYYAISSRAFGLPLDALDANGWRDVAPSLLRSLEVLRNVPIVSPTPFGARDFGYYATWREFLFATVRDVPQLRTHGWSERLRKSEYGTDAFARGLARLDVLTRSVQVDAAIVHGDLMNRNVLVDKTHVTGIFDWGCSFAGDFLYEVSNIVFWTPWYNGLKDFDLLGEAIAHHRSTAADLDDLDERLEVCALHIGLIHIATNAFTQDWKTLELTADRMISMMRN